MLARLTTVCLLVCPVLAPVLQRFLLACGTVCSSLLVQLPRLQSLHDSLRSLDTVCESLYTTHKHTNACVHNQRKKLRSCQGWSDARRYDVVSCVVLSSVLYIAHTLTRAHAAPNDNDTSLLAQGP